MAIVGEATLNVQVSVGKAVETLKILQQSVSTTFTRIEESISSAFELDQALIDLKTVTTVIGQLDSVVAQIESKKIRLAEPYREALEAVKELRNETLAISGVGEPSQALAEEAKLQQALFLQQTEGAHQAAVAKQRAYEETLATAKKAVGEERQFQEALFLQQTEEGHQAAAAKQQDYEKSLAIAKKAVGEERTLQEALFLSQTEDAHQAALAKQRIYEESLAVAKKAVGEERRLQESLFLLQTQRAHEAAVAKQQAYEAEVAAAKKATAAQERLGAELAASINRVNPQLFKDRQREFDLLIASASGVSPVVTKAGQGLRVFGQNAAASGRFASFFASAADKADTVLSRFGLNMRDLNVILGSGFLSTAGPALAVLLGVALVAAATKAFLALSKLGAEAERMNDRLQAGFGEGARVIEEFAQGSARNFGLTEEAAIRLTGTIGNLFQSFGTGQETAARFAVDLASAARIIVRTSFTTDTYEEALGKLKGALTGNVEALREYGIAVNETTLRDVARQHQIALTSGEMDAATKALLTYLFITDQANDRQDAFNKTTEDTLTEQEKLNAAFTELKTSIGEDLTPLFRDLVIAGQGIVGFIGNLYEAVTDVLGPLGELSSSISELLNLPEISETLFGADSEKAFEKFARGLGAIEEEISFLGSTFKGTSFEEQIDAFREKTNELFDDFVKGKIDADQFFTILAAGLDISPAEAQRQYESFFNVIANERPELEKYREELFNTTFAQKEAEEALRQHQEELKKSPEHLKKLIDAYENFNEVLEDNAERLKDAQKNVVEARKQGAKDVADAQESLDDARIDGAKRVADAKEALDEAEAERIDAIKDARKRLSDAQEDGAEAIKDAEEDLRDTRIKAAERVDDAERRLLAARRQRTESILDANLSLEEALARGDVFAERSAQLELSRTRRSQSVRDAERALDEARVQGAEDIAKAKKKLADTVEDQNEKIADAEEKLAETIEKQNERVAEAWEKLVEAREDATERILEAQERLDEAEEKAIERLDEAKRKLREVKEENAKRLNEAKKKVQELEGAWSGVNDEVDELIRKLDELRAKHGEFIQFVTQAPITGGNADLVLLNRRQHGGPLGKGQFGLVGEAGPELFIPNTSGTVISNDELLRALRTLTKSQNGGGASIVVQEAVNGEATAAAIAARLAASLNN